MKKSDLYFLAAAGVAQISNHTIPVEHAYKVVRFRKAFAAALEHFAEDDKAITEDAGIKDPEAFDKRLAQLRAMPSRTKAEQEEFEKKDATLARVKEMRDQLYNETVVLDCRTMPYDVWHELQKENAEKEVNGRKLDILSGRVEDLLEDVLWTAPGEETAEKTTEK